MSKNYLIIELLNSFSKQELDDFGEFCSCKYHNKDLHALALFKFLVKKVVFKQDFSDVIQMAAYEKTFKDKPKPTKALSQQQKSFLLTKMNVLLRIAENFLCNEALKGDSAKRNSVLLKKVLQKKQFTLFKRIENKEKKRLSEIKAMNLQNYDECFQIELSRLDYLYQQGLLLKEDNLDQLNKYLDIFYILNKYNILTTCLSLLDYTSKKTYNFDIFYDLSLLMKNPIYLNEALINAYRISTLQSKTNQQSYYFRLIELLKLNSQNIPESDLRGFFIVANNFCSKKIKEGNEEYYKFTYEQFKIMDKNNLIVEDSFVQVGTLKNIITVGCKIKEFSWSHEMVEKYKISVQKEYRLSVYHFNIGAIAYYKKQYDKALNHFIKVDKVNLAYDIDCRIMILKCHYELDEEYDERAMRRFVLAERYIQGNKELVKDDKKAYKNFIRFLLNIYRIKHNATRMTLESIISKIEKAEFISDKKWLLEKIKVLKKRI